VSRTVAVLLRSAVMVGLAALVGCVGAHGGVARQRPATLSSPAGPTARRRVVVVGRSVLGRTIRAVVIGADPSSRSVLIIGCVHGDETAGEAVTRALRRATLPPGSALWLIDAVNPDGCRAHTRQNAHGVDLNRNSPWHWRPLDVRGGTFWSGPRAASEPETQAILRLVRRLRPAVTVWFHQHARLIDDSGGDRGIERRYARRVGLPFRRYGTFPGSLTSWQNATFHRDTAFVVELPAGRMTAAAVRRHMRAVIALAH
jgi:murein peptide amidase A